MGYQYVAAAIQPEWARQLTPREHLVLIVMCQVALDHAGDGLPPGFYFAGRDYLILQTEGDLFERDPARRRAAERAVERALRRLQEVGAIQMVRKAVNGRRAEYLLTPFTGLVPVDNRIPDTIEDLTRPTYVWG